MSVSSGIGIGLDRTVVISDASISAKRIVAGDTTDTTNTKKVMKAATGETDKPLGVTLDATTAADVAIPVRMGGIAIVEVDGSGTGIDIGTSICATAAGVGVSSSTPDNAQQWAVGFALEPSTADGDEIEVFVSPHLIVKGTA